jgi:MerR family transcriptional regulator, copper efflux regulator
MSTYTIGEIAARSGFSTSALRYYERIGLVAPTERTEAGYRRYDDEAVGRLAFIMRAKQLGCTLPEIADLAEVWAGERCGPVQERLHDLVVDKIREARRQVDAAETFVEQLRRAAANLSVAPVDGPCDETCACAGAVDGVGTVGTVGAHDRVTSTTPESRRVVLGRARTRRPAEVPVLAPVMCTLDASVVPGRLARWRAIADRARSRTELAPGVHRLELGELDGRDLGELVALVAAEQRCCSFLAFTITVDARGVGVEVKAPAEAADIVGKLLGTTGEAA